MLMRFDPFQQLDQVAQQVFRQTARPATPMDAYRQGDEFVVQFDLPGVDPDSIELTVEKNVLTVAASRSRSYGEGAQLVISERPHGEFRRQLFLGEQLDTDNISADYDNGVLTLKLSVADQAKPRRVEISNTSRKKEIAGAAS